MEAEDYREVCVYAQKTERLGEQIIKSMQT